MSELIGLGRACQECKDKNAILVLQAQLQQNVHFGQKGQAIKSNEI